MKGVLIIFGLILMVAGGFGFALFGLGGGIIEFQLIALAVLFAGIILLFLGKTSGNRVVKSNLEVKIATNRFGKILWVMGLLFILLAIAGFVSGPTANSPSDSALWLWVGVILIIAGLVMGRKHPQNPDIVSDETAEPNISTTDKPPFPPAS